MKSPVFLFLLFACHPSFGQQPALQPFEVDSVAEPRGGMVALTNYFQANLRKPILAEAKGTGGRVIITAVVGSDGHVTDAKVLRSLRPDCDREALRVFRLFDAWKPAQKGGQPVPQLVLVPVLFTSNPPYTYADGARVGYFGEDMKPVPDSSNLARYKQVTPVDTNGFPSGDIVVFQQKNGDWEEYNRLPLNRVEQSRRGPMGRKVYLLGNIRADKQWDGYVFRLDSAGTLYQRTYYDNGRAGARLTYYANGAIAVRQEDQDKQYAVTSWHANGQVRQIWLADKNGATRESEPEKIIAFWDRDGQPGVTDGTGRAVYTETVISLVDTAQTTQYLEQGSYQNGLKQGIWTGRYADGSYAYEEQYDRGVCTVGKSSEAGRDTVRYTVREQIPQFKGGMPALGEFLNQNLKYPKTAIRANAQGKVFVSFVINTDGNVQDVAVLKGIGFGCDEEAKRVVSRMQGRWIPGIQRGRPVKVKFNLPINFNLN